MASCFTSCKNAGKGNDKGDGSPKALEDKSSYEFVSKRSSENLVESLYEELVEKTPELKDFESDFSKLQRSQDDSLSGFNKFNAKSNSYYGSANELITSVTDSVLKNKLKLLIQNSTAQYDSSVLQHTTLIKQINSKNASLSDLHTSLKLVRTLPLIQQYQLDKKPSLKSLEGLNHEMDRVRGEVDTLLKK